MKIIIPNTTSLPQHSIPYTGECTHHGYTHHCNILSNTQAVNRMTTNNIITTRTAIDTNATQANNSVQCAAKTAIHFNTEPNRKRNIDTLPIISTKSLGKRQSNTDNQANTADRPSKKTKMEKPNPENSVSAIEKRLAAQQHAEKIMSKYLNDSCPDPKLSWLVHTIKHCITQQEREPNQHNIIFENTEQAAQSNSKFFKKPVLTLNNL